MHLSTLWRNALLSTLKHLRQNVIKDKIWVDSSSPIDSYISQSQADSTDLEDLPPGSTEELAPNLGSISRSGGKKYRTVCRSQGRAHERGKLRRIVENWERSRSESGLGGVDGGVCVSDALDLLTGTLRRGFHFSAVTVQEYGVSRAWSDFQRGPFTPSILRAQLEGTNKDGNGESERVEGVDYLKRVSMTLRESGSFACSNRGE